jgi:hypothetical protein
VFPWELDADDLKALRESPVAPEAAAFDDEFAAERE